MRVEGRIFPPFIAKRVEGIFGYDILLYGFLSRRQWGNFSRSFARIGLLFIKWRRVKYKAARMRTFLVRLARSIPCVAVYKLRFTLEKEEKIYIYVCAVLDPLHTDRTPEILNHGKLRWFYISANGDCLSRRPMLFEHGSRDFEAISHAPLSRDTFFFTFNSPFLGEKCMKWFKIFRKYGQNTT